jgi:hypothetical protein
MARHRKSLADYTPRGLAGLKGFWTTCNRHYNGDARLMVNVFIQRGLMAQDPCPDNGAWTKPRISARLSPYWKAPPLHPEIEPPF